MAGKSRLDWQVLLSDEAWAEVPEAPAPSGDAVGERAHGPRAHAWRGIVLPLLLLLVVVAFVWDGGNGGRATAFGVRAVPALSADRLAARTRGVILTEHLHIHAAGADLATVQANAEALEAMYADLYAALGLAVEADPGAPDGRLQVVLGAENAVVWHRVGGRVALPSPGYLAAGETWDASDLLRQGWQVALLDGAVWDAGAVHAIPEGWLPVLHGLRLWLLWDAGGPLAEGRQEIVAWLSTKEPDRLPESAAMELCRRYGLWGRSPLDYSIPVGCTPVYNAVPFTLPVEIRLYPLGLPESPGDPESLSRIWVNQARNLSLALFIQYAADNYGRQSIPDLLAALKEHNSWRTLIPAVFAVSVEEFEAGWRAWLGKAYGGLMQNPAE